MVGVLIFDSPESYREFVECNQNIEVISLEVFPKQFNSVLVLTYKSSGIKLVNVIVKDNMRLREALEFYADPVTYESVSAYINGEKTECYPIDGDEGEIARKALGGLE